MPIGAVRSDPAECNFEGWLSHTIAGDSGCDTGICSRLDDVSLAVRKLPSTCVFQNCAIRREGGTEELELAGESSPSFPD